MRFLLSRALTKLDFMNSFFLQAYQHAEGI